MFLRTAWTFDGFLTTAWVSVFPLSIAKTGVKGEATGVTLASEDDSVNNFLVLEIPCNK